MDTAKLLAELDAIESYMMYRGIRSSSDSVKLLRLCREALATKEERRALWEYLAFLRLREMLRRRPVDRKDGAE